jgi:hypothetical protein
LAVPKAQNAIAEFLEFLRPSRVLIGLPEMRAAVQFNDQLKFGRAEVDDVFVDGMLPPESDAAEMTTP